MEDTLEAPSEDHLRVESHINPLVDGPGRGRRWLRREGQVLRESVLDFWDAILVESLLDRHSQGLDRGSGDESHRVNRDRN